MKCYNLAEHKKYQQLPVERVDMAKMSRKGRWEVAETILAGKEVEGGGRQPNLAARDVEAAYRGAGVAASVQACVGGERKWRK